MALRVLHRQLRRLARSRYGHQAATSRSRQLLRALRSAQRSRGYLEAPDMAAQTAAHPPAATASAASTTKTESASLTVRLKRAYEASGPEDGERFLVERLWPRGL